MKEFLFIIISLFAVSTFGCDCKTISKDAQYNTSDYVFLGKVEAVDEASLYVNITVQEVFKGQMDTTVQAILDDCSIFPRQDEIWLFYAKNHDGKLIYITKCGWSRSFNRPFSVSSSNYPPPPPSDASNFELLILNTLNTNKALSELQFDVLGLRNVRLNNLLIQSKQNDHPKEDKSDSLDFKILYGIIIMLILAIILLVFKLYRK